MLTPRIIFLTKTIYLYIIFRYHTHHMREMFNRDGHPEVFQEAYEHPDHDIDWDMVYDGFDAAVDWY